MDSGAGRVGRGGVPNPKSLALSAGQLSLKCFPANFHASYRFVGLFQVQMLVFRL